MVNETTPDRLLSVGDLADYLQVPHNTLYQWRHHGVGPRALRIGKYLRYRRSDVEAWLESAAQ